MRRRWPRCLAGCIPAAVWTAGALAAQPPAVSVEETLIALERGWNEAFYARDVEFLETVLADEFIATYDDGARGDKARELELAASFNQRVLSATQDDFIVQVHDDAAVVWFTLRVVGIRRGERAELTLRYTECLGAARRPVAVRLVAKHPRQSAVTSPRRRLDSPW